MINLPEEIKTMREFEGMTRKELAKKAKTSEMNVWYIERGKRNPSFAIIERIADVLGFQVSLKRKDSN